MSLSEVREKSDSDMEICPSYKIPELIKLVKSSCRKSELNKVERKLIDHGNCVEGFVKELREKIWCLEIAVASSVVDKVKIEEKWRGAREECDALKERIDRLSENRTLVGDTEDKVGEWGMKACEENPEVGKSRKRFVLSKENGESKWRFDESVPTVEDYKEKYEDLKIKYVALYKEKEELKQRELDGDQIVEELRHQNSELVQTIDELWLKNAESDKAAEMSKKRLENLAPRISELEASLASFLNVNVKDLANIVKGGETSAGVEEAKHVHITDSEDKMESLRNGSALNGEYADNGSVSGTSPELHSICNATGIGVSGLLKTAEVDKGKAPMTVEEGASLSGEDLLAQLFRPSSEASLGSSSVAAGTPRALFTDADTVTSIPTTLPPRTHVPVTVSPRGITFEGPYPATRLEDLPSLQILEGAFQEILCFFASSTASPADGFHFMQTCLNWMRLMVGKARDAATTIEQGYRRDEDEVKVLRAQVASLLSKGWEDQTMMDVLRTKIFDYEFRWGEDQKEKERLGRLLELLHASHDKLEASEKASKTQIALLEKEKVAAQGREKDLQEKLGQALDRAESAEEKLAVAVSPEELKAELDAAVRYAQAETARRYSESSDKQRQELSTGHMLWGYLECAQMAQGLVRSDVDFPKAFDIRRLKKPNSEVVRALSERFSSLLSPRASPAPSPMRSVSGMSPRPSGSGGVLSPTTQLPPITLPYEGAASTTSASSLPTTGV